MACIIHLETATKNCSVAISENGQLLAELSVLNDHYSHSEKLHSFIEKVLKKAGKTPKELDAVAISMGPGSYTGLRIGVAAAKGLCYALELPLIALNTLEIMAQTVLPISNNSLLIPMLDARRMEVYTMVLDAQKQVVQNTWAEVLNTESFTNFTTKPLLVFGVGTEKFQAINPSASITFLEEPKYPLAKDMIPLAFKAYTEKRFEFLAYFEPFYLKEFLTTPAKKIL